MNKNTSITNILNRQVKYASCLYDFETDGVTGASIDALPKQTSALPNQCTVVSVMVEFLITPVSASGAGLTYVTTGGTSGVPVLAWFNHNSYSAGDIINYPIDEVYIPDTRSGYLSTITAGDTLTAGRFAITVGYMDNIYATTNPE